MTAVAIHQSGSGKQAVDRQKSTSFDREFLINSEPEFGNLGTMNPISNLQVDDA